VVNLRQFQDFRRDVSFYFLFFFPVSPGQKGLLPAFLGQQILDPYFFAFHFFSFPGRLSACRTAALAAVAVFVLGVPSLILVALLRSMLPPEHSPEAGTTQAIRQSE
jgi:hypothetical protein